MGDAFSCLLFFVESSRLFRVTADKVCVFKGFELVLYEYWPDIWFLVAQAMSWYYEHGIIKDVNSDREGFIEQAGEEFVAAMRLYHETYGQSSWITDWSKIGTHSIIDSKDGGATGYSAYDYVSTGVNLVMDHPEYYHSYHLWIYDWDKSQPWKLAGQSGVPMQRLLIAVPDPEEPAVDTVQLTVRKLEAGTNKPMSGVSFKIENANDPAAFSVTRATGADGTITLTKEADDLTAGQYLITEEAVPEGYVAQTASQLVTVLPNSSANSVFTFYNEPESPDTPTPDTPSTGTGTIKKVDADNPTVGIPGAVIRITSVKLDDGGSFFGEYVTKDGGYILKEDLDFSNLPKGSYLAEEITPPEGFILSSDVSKVKQPFVWDGEHDVSLVFENSSKVKVQLKKVDESSAPLAGAIFVILRDGQVIGTEETKADGTITVSNVTEGYYEFREVSAPAGFDCDRSPVGVHVEAEDLQGEQTIVVTKMNHHKRALTIQKRDAETGDLIPGTSFHVWGINLGYENDVVTGADGAVTLSDMPSGCYEVTETDVPKPYILDTNNRKTVWIDAEKDQDVVVDFVNSKLPGVRLVKRDRQTNQPIPGVTFKIEEVDGGFTDQRQTDKDGMIFWENLRPGAYKVYEVEPAPNYVHDDTVHVVQLEPNHTTTIELTNILKPTLKIMKVDSVTHSPIAKVKFQIWRGSDDTITGELNDLGTFQTNDSGEIVLEHIDTGWYRIKELEPAPGYTIKQPDTQDIYLKAGEIHTVTFQNKLVDAITRNHDVDLLLPGQKPCAYFVIISAQDSAYRFLSSLFFSLALPRLSDYARLEGKGGRLPVLVNFCLDEYCNIGYMDGIADALNSIRGFNMSCQVVVQNLSQWQKKYPGKEWENQLATFDQTLYMGCNDWASADYISKKCGKVTISLTSQSKPQPPLYGFVYGNTRPYSQTRSSSQRELMQPDEILRLDRRQCIALFQGRKPALLYKLSPEELPGYDTLRSCRVADYTPEWRLKEEQKKEQTEKRAAQPPGTAPNQKPPAAPDQPDPDDEPDLSQSVEYQLTGQGLGMVELGPTAWWAVRMRTKNSRREGDPGGSLKHGDHIPLLRRYTQYWFMDTPSSLDFWASSLWRDLGSRSLN